VQVDLTQRRQETVGVVNGVLDPVAVGDPDPVVRDLRRGQDTYPYALELVAELDARPIVHLHNDAAGQRLQRAHGDGAVVRVGPEDSMRVVMRPGDQPLELSAFDGLHR